MYGGTLTELTVPSLRLRGDQSAPGETDAEAAQLGSEPPERSSQA